MSRLLKLLTSVVTTLAIIGVGLVVYVQTQNEDDTYEVTAFFEKGIGLFENSDVTILGVPVGTITNVEPVGDSVRVDMVIEGEYKIPADTKAEIVPISVISDRYVEFEVYQGGPVLQDGATLQLTDTEIPAELDDVFLQLKKLLDALKPDGEGELGSLGELVVALDKALEGREQDLKGALENGARLTQTLARAREDISGLLINLDQLFSKLAPRAGSIATLNKNFAIVMRFLSESRGDLEGTLEGLGDITEELGDLVKDDGSKVASLLRRAARITPVILKNQESIEQSLAWLGVVGEALANAYHPGAVNATDVRSNLLSATICNDIEDLPIDPDDFPPPLGGPGGILEQLLEEIRNEFCDPPRSTSPPITPPGSPEERAVTPEAPEDLLPKMKDDCKKGIRRAKRQIERIEEIGIPGDVKEGVLLPLEENLKELSKKCREIGDIIENPEDLEKLLEGLPDDLRESIEDSFEDPEGPPAEEEEESPVDDLTGNASGASATATEEESDSWIDGMMRFLGVTS
ncbi:MAG: MCE family protein [Actinomycetota bacterium]|nr:MCE family protein [Actinomycetota bacterium]